MVRLHTQQGHFSQTGDRFRRSAAVTGNWRLPLPDKPTPSRQLAGFIAKYDASVAKLARQCRAALRKRLPTAIEQVYDNYQFLAIGYCSTDRTSDCIVSLAVSPKGVALSFYNGASIPDPDHVLQGAGKQNRFVRLETAGTLSSPPVERLISAAIANAKNSLPTGKAGYIMIKSVSKKQRPRRSSQDRRTRR
jgi:Domain of unknown function (DU1801)